MKILIAGGAGYLGSVLVPSLLDRGYKVVVVDLLWFGNQLPKNAHVIQKDVMDLTQDELNGFDQVIFLAGLSNDPMAEFSPSQNFVYNAAAPALLGYLSKKAGVRRYIYAGSCSVYGYTVNKLYDENSPTISNYPYGISKLQGEQAVMQMEDELFSVISLRQGTVSGYSPRMRLDLVVNAMFKSAISDQVITVNNPAIWRPILSINDAVKAYIRAIEAQENISGIFNIASGNFTVGEIGDLVKRGVEENLGVTIKLNIKKMNDFRNYKVSYEKAINVLGFKPSQDINSIVKNLELNLEKYRDFNNSDYYNIQVFKKNISANN